MRKSEAYPSKYFRAADVEEGWCLPVEIEMARMETFKSDRGGESQKLVVYFRRVKSGLVCGPTVWDQIAETIGEEDTDDWAGHRIELFRDKTTMAGKTVPCIRVREADALPKKPVKKPAVKAEDLEFNDSIEV
jgi:hypothetical protein